MSSSSPQPQGRSRHFQHLKILWLGTVLLVLSMFAHSLYRISEIQKNQLVFTPDSLNLTPPGIAIGHPEFQSTAVSLSYGPGIIEPRLGRLLISK